MTNKDIFTAFAGLLGVAAVALLFGWLLGWFAGYACIICAFAGLAELGDE